jgi:hypothetical protein
MYCCETTNWTENEKEEEMRQEDNIRWRLEELGVRMGGVWN